MADTLRSACLQMTSGPDVVENLDKAAHFIRKAAAEGVHFVVTPENTCQMRLLEDKDLQYAMSQEDHIGVPFFSDLAKELCITLLVGSMTVKTSSEKLSNRSFLFAKDGALVSTYDKIHLFDVQLTTGESYCESETIKPGQSAVISKIDSQFSIGMSICYDLRFAYLYRDLAQQGASILCVPAAFTIPTGQAHWEVLLRARAIETGCYVLAPSQVGEHIGGRKTYGHSMIIDPWGKVLEQQEKDEGIIFADLDVEQVRKARAAIPALQHDRDYTINKVGL